MLDRACQRHGGLAVWRSLRRLTLTLHTLDGPLTWMKGLGATFPRPSAVDVFPHECRTIFHAYPDARRQGIFDRGDVRIENRDGRGVTDSSPRHRETFSGWTKYRRWSALDGLYFFGYALWHYHTLPFTLYDATLLGFRRLGQGDQAQHVIDVEFPPGLPTHGRRQSFHFDHDGWLRRHDYVAEIVGAWAHGAHDWLDYRDVSGIPVAMRRRVRVCAFGESLPIPVLHATFSDARALFAVASDRPDGN
jgi:hypothetical protein